MSISSVSVAELLEQINTHHVNDDHALQILEACLVAKFDQTEHNVMADVWNQFRMKNIQLNYTHYDCMLSYYGTHGNGTAAQQIYDDLIDAGFHADWLVQLFRFAFKA